MQTFLPYSSFEQSFKVLDYGRLGKQRVEAKQIYNILDGKQTTNGWKNHPAVKMWIGYKDALALYHNLCIDEWVSRRYRNTMIHLPVNYDNIIMPWWMGNEDFHRAMRARLIEKVDFFYLPIFGEIDKGFNGGKYFWPVNETKTFRII